MDKKEMLDLLLRVVRKPIDSEAQKRIEYYSHIPSLKIDNDLLNKRDKAET